LLRQIRQYALNIPVVASASCGFRDTLELVSAEDVEGVYAETAVILRGNPDPAVRAWADRMRARFKSEPDEMALLEYDVTRTLIEAMRQFGTDSKGIQTGLKEITYGGLMMKYASDSEGNMGRQIVIGQVRKKELQPLERYEFTKGDSERL
jgi:ABC-type branched-subunit amino acid transport system substrate-binding protein